MALSVLQWNANGLRGHKDQLKNYLNNTPNLPDIVCVQETILKEKVQVPKIEGYDAVRKDCLIHQKGGLVIYIKIGLTFTVLNVEDIINVEIQGIEIKTEIGHLKIYNVYLPPGHNINKEDLQKIFINKRTIMVGDFNAHNKSWGCTKNNSRGNIIEEIIAKLNMVVLNTGQATFIKSNQSNNNSVIDLSVCSQDIALT